LNADGKLDLVTGGYPSRVNVLLGNGDGTFQAYKSSQADNPYALTLADLDGDRRLDLAVSHGYDFGGWVGVSSGNGDGTFRDETVLDTSNDPGDQAVGDVNGDRALDLVVVNASATVSVILGHGDGTFEPARLYFAGGGGSVALGDLNKDSRPDIVASGSVAVHVLPNDSFWARMSDGSTVVVQGTSSDDVISVRRKGAKMIVNCAENSFSYRAADVHGIQVFAGDGNDRVTIGAGVTHAQVRGEDGNDTLIGTDSDIDLEGGNDNDVLSGGSGDDYILGGAGNDRINGADGDDTIVGEFGNDRIDGGKGHDHLSGNDGSDIFFGSDLLNDIIDGGAGPDTAYADVDDVLTLIEFRR
jgi:Ca2+-binding RTX toxin-like protein